MHISDEAQKSPVNPNLTPEIIQALGKFESTSPAVKTNSVLHDILREKEQEEQAREKRLQEIKTAAASILQNMRELETLSGSKVTVKEEINEKKTAYTIKILPKTTLNRNRCWEWNGCWVSFSTEGTMGYGDVMLNHEDIKNPQKAALWENREKSFRKYDILGISFGPLSAKKITKRTPEIMRFMVQRLTEKGGYALSPTGPT
ncbi:MAG: hypothetical protein PHE27_02730 [Alphaproteobacteria bacterium]|nr:hypothetical protein [Alphaproteobacteria bacterium]